MNLRLKTMLVCGWFALGMALMSCNNTPEADKPETHRGKIESLQQQVQADSKTLNDIEANEFVAIQRDFRVCDSMLQYLSQEQVDKSFEKLQLVQAYIEQFKFTKPLMQADMDSTLHQLNRLKADAVNHYLSDSLVTVYLENETEYVNKQSNQVRYFQDRFSKCQEDLDELKKMK
jgi:hypothetical protein